MNNDDDLLETNRFITGVDVNLDGDFCAGIFCILLLGIFNLGFLNTFKVPFLPFGINLSYKLGLL